MDNKTNYLYDKEQTFITCFLNKYQHICNLNLLTINESNNWLKEQGFYLASGTHIIPFNKYAPKWFKKIYIVYTINSHPFFKTKFVYKEI